MASRARGYEIGGGIGAKMADASREVYVMGGDGSYPMHPSEIVTAVQEGIKLIIVFVVNHGFQSSGAVSGTVGVERRGTRYRQHTQDGQLDGEVHSTDLLANAASLGAHPIRARTRRTRGGSCQGTTIPRHYRHRGPDRYDAARTGLGVVAGRSRRRGCHSAGSKGGERSTTWRNVLNVRIFVPRITKRRRLPRSKATLSRTRARRV